VALPGTVGLEHVAVTVPDLEAARAFFVDVLGGREVGRVAFSRDLDGSDMEVSFNAHPDAVAELVTLDLHGTTLELFHYDAPDLADAMPRNCDPGGHHLGLRVDDIVAAAAYLASVPGVRVLGAPSFAVRPDGVARGWVYFLTPWGLQMELAEEHPVGGRRDG